MANTIDFNVSTNAVNVLNQTGAAAENTAKGFTSAKAELRALQQQMLTMDQSSAEFKKASARAAELKDNISDLSAEISANAGNAFEGLSNNVSLFGSRLMNLDLRGAGQSLSAMGNAVSRIDFKTLQSEVGGLTTGLLNLGKAVISNPFFLAAGALTALIVYWDDINNAIKGTTASVNQLNEANAKLESQNKVLAHRIEIEKIINGNSERAYQLTVQKLNKDIEIASNELEVKKISGDINGIREAENTLLELRNQLNGVNVQHEVDRAKLVESAYRVAYENWGKEHDAQKLADSYDQERVLKAEERRRLEEQIKVIQKEQEQQTKNKIGLLGVESVDNKIKIKQNNEILTLQSQIKKLKQDENALAIASKKIIEESLKVDDKKLDTQKDITKELEVQKEIIDNSAAEEFRSAYNAISDLAKQQTKENELRLLSEKDRELQINKEKYDALIAEADLRGIDTKVFLDAQLAEEDAIKKKWRDKENEDNAIAAAKELALLQQAEQAKAQLRIDAMKTSLSIIGDLAQAFAGESEAQQRKAFQIQKGVSIATATIDTYLAAQGAYRSQMAISTPDAPVRAAVAAGIAIAQGLARVAVISKQQFNGGGSTSGGSGGGSLPSASGGTQAPSPANFAFLGMQPQQQPPLQAYVVSGQVSSNLEAQQLINNQARLGG